MKIELEITEEQYPKVIKFLEELNKDKYEAIVPQNSTGKLNPFFLNMCEYEVARVGIKFDSELKYLSKLKNEFRDKGKN